MWTLKVSGSDILCGSQLSADAEFGGRLLFREGEFCIDIPVSGNLGVLYGR